LARCKAVDIKGRSFSVRICWKSEVRLVPPHRLEEMGDPSLLRLTNFRYLQWHSPQSLITEKWAAAVRSWFCGGKVLPCRIAFTIAPINLAVKRASRGCDPMIIAKSSCGAFRQVDPEYAAIA
jgi:hypothetical protein